MKKFTHLTQLLSLLSNEDKKRGILLVGLILLMAVMEGIGIASILPLISLIADPNVIEEGGSLSVVRTVLPNVTHQGFILIAGSVFLALFLASLVVRAYAHYSQIRYGLLVEYRLGQRLIKGYLNQPYEWHLTRNSSDLSKSILSETSMAVHHGLLPGLMAFAQGMVIISIISVLMIANFLVALGVGVFFVSVYSFIYGINRKRVARIGVQRVAANKDKFLALSDAFGAIKEIKFSVLEDVYIGRYARPAMSYAKCFIAGQAATIMPRYLLEGLVICFGLTTLMLIVASGNSLSDILPLFGLYGLAAFRLMPSMQNAFTALTQMQLSKASVNLLVDDLNSFQQSMKKDDTEEMNSTELTFQSLTFNNIAYSYPGSTNPALQNISFEIRSGKSIGVVGQTGSGKSTLIDVLLGLLSVETGSIVVNAQHPLSTIEHDWKNIIGFVPQTIYLSDQTIAENIALGVEEEAVDIEGVRLSAKRAGLDEFITGLPEGYQTKVGERGVRLSGGQRQRIGIARALYRQPQILVFDEATSALDNTTEKEIIRSIQDLAGSITIIMVAHRLTTVRGCDSIIFMEQGRLVDNQTFDVLVDKNQSFRSMVAAQG
jgi:ABC-type multidrug transport system fused ATPase/permease subunit